MLTGAMSMAPGTLCLTYDDGPGATEGDRPGPRTLPLATYLADEGVPATFFMSGRHIDAMPDAPAAVRALGHLVGNHTWSHPNLVDAHEAGVDLADELSRTAAAIGSHGRQPTFVRPPYGAWSRGVAAALNAAAKVPGRVGQVGPVGWDVETGDWRLWSRGVDAQEAVRAHLRAVEAVGRGIVLMHDSTADSESIKNGNRAYETARLLVPELRRRGYRFVALDEVSLH